MTESEAKRRVREMAKEDGYAEGDLAAEAVEAMARVYLGVLTADGMESPRRFWRAPNGKKSNLNRTQWLVVRTPAFKRWFGDSVVVDENGEPKVMYHGGEKEIREFNPSFIKVRKSLMTLWSGPGFYFSDKRRVGEIYAKGDGFLNKCFLRLENPIEIDETGNAKSGKGGITNAEAVAVMMDGDNVQWLDITLASILARQEPQGGVSRRGKEYWKGKTRKERVEAFVRGLNTDAVKLKVMSEAYGAKSQKKMLESIVRHTGFDGVIHEVAPEVMEYVVYDPKAVKSAEGNDGRFSRATAVVFDGDNGRPVAPCVNTSAQKEGKSPSSFVIPKKGSSNMSNSISALSAALAGAFKGKVNSSLPAKTGLDALAEGLDAIAEDIVDRHGRHHEMKGIPPGGQYMEEGQFLRGEAAVQHAIRQAGEGKRGASLRDHLAPAYARIMANDSTTRATIQRIRQEFQGLGKRGIMAKMAQHFKDMKKHAEAYDAVKDMDKEQFKRWLEQNPEYNTGIVRTLMEGKRYNRRYGNQEHEAWEEAKWSVGARCVTSAMMYREASAALNHEPDQIMEHAIERAQRELDNPAPAPQEQIEETPSIPQDEYRRAAEQYFAHHGIRGGNAETASQELRNFVEKASRGELDLSPAGGGIRSNDRQFFNDIKAALGEDHPIVRAISNGFSRQEGASSPTPPQENITAVPGAGAAGGALTYRDRDGNEQTVQHNDGGLKATIHPSELGAVQAEMRDAFRRAGEGEEGAEEYAHALSHFLGRGQDDRSAHPGMRADGVLKHQLVEKMEARLAAKQQAAANASNGEEAAEALTDIQATERAVRRIAAICGITSGDIPEDDSHRRVVNLLREADAAAEPTPPAATPVSTPATTTPASATPPPTSWEDMDSNTREYWQARHNADNGDIGDITDDQLEQAQRVLGSDDPLFRSILDRYNARRSAHGLGTVTPEGVSSHAGENDPAPGDGRSAAAPEPAPTATPTPAPASATAALPEAVRQRFNTEVRNSTGVAPEQAVQESAANAQNIGGANRDGRVNGGHIHDAIASSYNARNRATELQNQLEEAQRNGNAAEVERLTREMKLANVEANALSHFSSRNTGGMAQRGDDGNFTHTGATLEERMNNYLGAAWDRAQERHDANANENAPEQSAGVLGVRNAITRMGEIMGFTPTFNGRNVSYRWNGEGVGAAQPAEPPAPAAAPANANGGFTPTDAQLRDIAALYPQGAGRIPEAINAALNGEGAFGQSPSEVARHLRNFNGGLGDLRNQIADEIERRNNLPNTRAQQAAAPAAAPTPTPAPAQAQPQQPAAGTQTQGTQGAQTFRAPTPQDINANTGLRGERTETGANFYPGLLTDPNVGSRLYTEGNQAQMRQIREQRGQAYNWPVRGRNARITADQITPELAMQVAANLATGRQARRHSQMALLALRALANPVTMENDAYTGRRTLDMIAGWDNSRNVNNRRFRQMFDALHPGYFENRAERQRQAQLNANRERLRQEAQNFATAGQQVNNDGPLREGVAQRVNFTEADATDAVNRMAQAIGEEYRPQIQQAMTAFQRNGVIPDGAQNYLNRTLPADHPVRRAITDAQQRVSIERNRVKHVAEVDSATSNRLADVARNTGVAYRPGGLATDGRGGSRGYNCYLAALVYGMRRAGLDVPIKNRPAGYGPDSQNYFIPMKMAMESAGWDKLNGRTREETIQNLERLARTKPNDYTLELWSDGHHGTSAFLRDGKWYHYDVFYNQYSGPHTSAEIAPYIQTHPEGANSASLEPKQERLARIAIRKGIPVEQRSRMTREQVDELVDRKMKESRKYAESSYGHMPGDYTEDLIREALRD